MAKELINRMKMQPMEKRKIFASHVSENGLIFRNKVLLQLHRKNRQPDLKTSKRTE
jgi:hypothetical protein